MSVFQNKQDGTSNEPTTLLVPKGKIYHSFSQSILDPKRGSKQIQKDLFDAKDGEGNGTGPELLDYRKCMLAAYLANQCTCLRIVSGARVMIHEVVLLHPDSRFLFYHPKLLNLN